MIFSSEDPNNFTLSGDQSEFALTTAKSPGPKSDVRAKSGRRRFCQYRVTAPSPEQQNRPVADDCANLHGPLPRFFQKQVGRPWVTIWRELRLRAAVSRASSVALRIDVENFVATQVCHVQGKLVHTTGLWAGQPLTGSWRQRFFVCPESGLLQAIPANRTSFPMKHPT